MISKYSVGQKICFTILGLMTAFNTFNLTIQIWAYIAHGNNLSSLIRAPFLLAIVILCSWSVKNSFDTINRNKGVK